MIDDASEKLFISQTKMEQNVRKRKRGKKTTINSFPIPVLGDYFCARQKSTNKTFD